MKKTVIGAFLLFFAANLFLSYLSYKGSSYPDLHSQILKYFTPDDIAKGEAHARAGFAVGLVRSIIFMLMILVLSFSSFAHRLEALCSRLTGNRFFLTSVCFFSLLYLLLSLISLPFNFYFSYILEHRFGFSNMSIGFWLWTWMKSFSLDLAFISLTGSAALLIIRKFRFYSVFIVPVGGLIIGLAMMILYPVAILPLFYEVHGVENHQLEQRIIETAQKSGVSVDKIYVIKESEYSNHTNAFFVGFGNHKKIYLYDTLIKKHSEPEVILILTHEIGHWVYNHTLKGTLIGFAISLAVFLLVYLCVLKLQADPGLKIGEIHSPSAVPLYFLLFIIFSTITSPVQMIISRSMERNADRYSLEMTRDPDSFISAEIRLARDNGSRLNGHPVPAFFRSSHPAALERIKMAEQYKTKMQRDRK